MREGERKYLELLKMPQSKKLELGLTSNAKEAKYCGVSEQTFYKYKKTHVNGVFDYKQTIREALPEITLNLVELATAGKTPRDIKAIELILKSLGQLVEKREDTLKVEYTSSQIADNAERFIGYLRESLETNSGTCPVCRKPNLLLAEVCGN